MIDPRGGMLPGPPAEHARVASLTAEAASGGTSGNVGERVLSTFGSKKSVRSLAFASLKVIAGRFHLRSTIARTDVWSWTTCVTYPDARTVRPRSTGP